MDPPEPIIAARDHATVQSLVARCAVAAVLDRPDARERRQPPTELVLRRSCGCPLPPVPT